jgi:hypothetical protein
MYKLYKSPRTNESINVVIRLSDNACIPFDPANTDYAEFKKAVTAGAELQDADGNVMSPEAAQEFIRTLP